MSEMRAQRGEESTERRGDKIKKNANQWVRVQSKKVDYRVQFYYEIAIGNINLLFKITSSHIPKHIVQT